MKRRTFIQSLGAAGVAAAALPQNTILSRTRVPELPDDPASLLENLVDAAVSQGADYADARFIVYDSESISARKDTVYSIMNNQSAGIAVRTYKNGNWGYAATSDLEKLNVRTLSQNAVNMAEALGNVQQIPFFKQGRITESTPAWSSPYKQDPMSVPLKEKTDFLLGLSRPPLEKEAIVYTVANLFASKKQVLYANSLGGRADQTYIVTYPNFGITAFYQKKGRIDSRNSDIEPVQAGWEITSGYGFEEELKRATNQVLEKNSAAKTVEPGGYDLIMSSSHLWKIFYDTLVPHIDPYTVYSLDGDSPNNRLFKPGDIGTKQFSTPLFNVDFNNSLPRGLATTRVDDAGMPPATGKIIEDGTLRAFPASDELAGLGGDWNGHSTRGETWDNEPKFAMPNLLLRPGGEDLSTKDLAQGVSLGLLVSGRSQTILSSDRKSFRTTGQLGWLIENGEIKHMVRDFVYEAGTTYFWSMLDALGGKNSVTLGGDMFPQNNSPIWTTPFSIAAPAARFTNINVFSMAGGVK